MNNIKLICFDLDDTLWPCMPTIHYAEDVYYQWLKTSKPAVTEKYSATDIRDKRRDLKQRTPSLAHDMSKLRIHSLYELADEFNDDKDWVIDAFDAFYQARQQVNFFEDVAPVLEKLKPLYQIAAVTNGNADIYTTELADFFDVAVSAAEAGKSKPDPAVFQLLQQKTGVEAGSILHVGDHPCDDIEGANRAGIRSVWLDRQQIGWSSTVVEPDYIAENLYQLLEILALQ